MDNWFFDLKLHLVLLWTLFALFNGLYDAVFYSIMDYTKKWKVHPHIFAGLMRITVGILVVIPNLPDIMLFLKDLAGLGLMFSLWHNGFYYVGRRYWFDNIKDYHFLGDSDTTTSWKIKLFGKEFMPFEYGGIMRIVMFIAGFLIYTDILA